MQHFRSVDDVSSPTQLVEQVLRLKQQLGPELKEISASRVLALLFFNPSLRTRLSSQRAAQILGLESMTLDLASSWPIEMMEGQVMDADKSEHIKEAAPVISQYCDLLGIRSFPKLKDRAEDYAEPVLGAFTQYGRVPVINLESATRHPLQGLADMATIAEHRPGQKARVVLSWAPHPKALPQSVANSFAAWTRAMGHELTITHPRGYELDPAITGDARIEYDPAKAYEGADFVYAKNWSSYKEYGQIVSQDRQWTVDTDKMSKTNGGYFMHCLPVRRNVVVSDAVLDSAHSLVIQQANNRTFAMAAVLQNILHAR